MGYRIRAAAAEQNQQPKKPRKIKPFEVSFYYGKDMRPVSADSNLYSAPMYVAGIRAMTGEEAEGKVREIHGGTVIRSWRSYYKNRPFVEGSLSTNKRRYYVKFQDGVLQEAKAGKLISGKFYYKRKNPNCLECGEPNTTNAQYCTRECYRKRKNRGQLVTRATRFSENKEKLTRPCRTCVIREAKEGRTHCSKCLGYPKNKKQKTPEQRLLIRFKRLHKNINRALELLGTITLESCERYKRGRYQALRFPHAPVEPRKVRYKMQGTCRSCLHAWFIRWYPEYIEQRDELIEKGVIGNA
jgi:hypothetical protein